MAKKVANARATMLNYGDSATRKELIALALRDYLAIPTFTF
jgi:hypothetical protein